MRHVVAGARRYAAGRVEPQAGLGGVRRGGDGGLGEFEATNGEVLGTVADFIGISGRS